MEYQGAQGAQGKYIRKVLHFFPPTFKETKISDIGGFHLAEQNLKLNGYSTMLDVKYFKYNVATSVHKKFLSIHYFCFSYGVVNELIADVSFVLGSFKLCYIQNLVKVKK